MGTGAFVTGVVLATAGLALAPTVLASAGDKTMTAELKKIVYIEASTGRAWNLPELPKRVGDRRFSIDFHARYDFDKSPVVNKILNGTLPKPDVLVIQECAVYFPGPVDAYKTQYRNWIREIKTAGIAPVIATTVPPARRQGWWEDTKDFVKERILGRESQYDQVVQFNEWLRALARDEAVVLLDLEKTLRIDDHDRHMRDAYNAGDGIHLNESAYRELDRLLHETVREKLL